MPAQSVGSRERQRVDAHNGTQSTRWRSQLPKVGFKYVRGLMGGAHQIDPRLSTRSDFDDGLESTVEHPLAVARHIVAFHHLGQSRIFHHLRIDLVAMGAGLEQDP